MQHVMRSRPNFNPAQYSVDWTNIVTSHLKKQLGEIMLPTPFRPGVTIRQPFQGVLSDPESRDKWITRFSYSYVFAYSGLGCPEFKPSCLFRSSNRLDLLREFVSEGLVDQPTFMSWLASVLQASNVAQLDFVIRISEEHFESLLENRAFLAPFVEACLARITEVSVGPVGVYHC